MVPKSDRSGPVLWHQFSDPGLWIVQRGLSPAFDFPVAAFRFGHVYGPMDALDHGLRLFSNLPWAGGGQTSNWDSDLHLKFQQKGDCSLCRSARTEPLDTSDLANRMALADRAL